MEATTEPPVGPKGGRFQRLALLIGSAIAATNIWTGAPLFAVWVGSRIQGNTSTSMSALLAVMGVLIVGVVGLTLALSWMNGRYDDLIQRPKKQRQSSPWLRSLRGERTEDLRQQRGITGVERLVIVSVLFAVLASEVWFFFLAGSSIGHA